MLGFRAGVVKSADTADLRKLSARRETGGVELLKVGGTLKGNPEPSPKVFREGVETRRAAPKPLARNGEGIVQTTNSHSEAAKVEVARKSADLNRSWGFKSPRPHHKLFWIFINWIVVHFGIKGLSRTLKRPALAVRSRFWPPLLQQLKSRPSLRVRQMFVMNASVMSEPRPQLCGSPKPPTERWRTHSGAASTRASIPCLFTGPS